ENDLPPDNLQTAPHDMVAHRTSPTNIGLYLLATACAREFGWIGRDDMIERLEATLATLANMQRHRGHFLNWYDTTTTAPLLPLYVSTVDSGNLCVHLLAVAQACLEAAESPNDDVALRRGLAASKSRIDELRAADEPPPLAAAVSSLVGANDVLVDMASDPDRFRQRLDAAASALDAGFYDLLASESRSTGLWAIAKGDVPAAHWAALGRPFYAVGALAGLRSWSGSMFEYLMPTLVLDEPHGSVLHSAAQAAVLEQIAFAHEQHVPWGISESPYAGSDHTLAYQYAPQGVPKLALRRTPADELVIAPYATALAAQVAPPRPPSNLLPFEQARARLPYGFIEALDYTPARQSGHEGVARVYTFMAHHQGMSIVAFAHVLLDRTPRRWGMSDPRIEAVSSLLHERAPREVPVMHEAPARPAPGTLSRRGPGMLHEVLPGMSAIEPTHL